MRPFDQYQTIAMTVVAWRADRPLCRSCEIVQHRKQDMAPLHKKGPGENQGLILIKLGQQGC